MSLRPIEADAGRTTSESAVIAIVIILIVLFVLVMIGSMVAVIVKSRDAVVLSAPPASGVSR
jgi:flagellar basal body-associated protein FliL